MECCNLERGLESEKIVSKNTQHYLAGVYCIVQK